MSHARTASEYPYGIKQCPSGYILIGADGPGSPAVKTCLSKTRKVFSIPAGVFFSVTFPDNPTTGLSWGIMHIPDSVMLVMAGYTPNESCQSGMSGCSGEFISTFKTIRSGAGDIVFTHGHPWKNNTTPATTLSINTQ